MKKFTFSLLICLGLFQAKSQSQIDLPITWDDTANIDYTTIAFEGGISMADLDPTNAANNVLKFIKPTGAQAWAGVTLSTTLGLASTIPFTPSANTVSMKFFAPASGMSIMLKAEVAGSPTIFVEATATTTVANGWETLVFDFASPSNGTINYANNYNLLSVFPTFLAPAANDTFFVDSVYFGGATGGPIGLQQIDLPISWDDTANVDYTTVAFEGGQSMADIDPANPANNVLKFTKPTGAQPWAGVTLGDQTLANPIPFTTSEKLITVMVYSPAAGMPIMLKAEIQGGGGFAEAQDTSTVANQWELLSFDFNSPTAGSIDPNLSYNMISFFGDFLNPANGQIFYIDDVNFGMPAPPTHDVTFMVDMNGYSGTITGLNVSGNFNDWCGTCNQMSDANMDGIWEVTLPIAADSIEWKYTMNNWAVQENFTEGDPCTKTTGGFTNRFAIFSGDTTLGPVCWEQCAACPQNIVNVTFRVDMSEVTETFTTPELNGTFNGWCGTCNAMSDEDGDNVWEVTIPFNEGDSIEYKFSADNWTIQEMNDPEAPCTNGNTQYTNRVLEIPAADITLEAVCWGSCYVCDSTNSVNEINASAFAVYPNPAKDMVTVSGLNDNSSYTITVVDMLGKTQIVTYTRNSSLVIDTKNLENGIYFITISNNASMQTQRIVVSH